MPVVLSQKAKKKRSGPERRRVGERLLSTFPPASRALIDAALAAAGVPPADVYALALRPHRLTADQRKELAGLGAFDATGRFVTFSKTAPVWNVYVRAADIQHGSFACVPLPVLVYNPEKILWQRKNRETPSRPRPRCQPAPWKSPRVSST